MTQIDYKQIEKVKDVSDLVTDIKKIEQVFQDDSVDDLTLKQLIGELNEKYEENTLVYKIVTNSVNRGNNYVSVQNAGRYELLQDLQWKLFYLRAKLFDKTIDEIKKEWGNQ